MPKLQDMVWAQEEPKNNGAWSFVEPLLEQCLGRGRASRHAAALCGARRRRLAATGLAKRHAAEQAALIAAALGHSSGAERTAVAAQ